MPALRTNPFCRSLRLSAQALTLDSDLKMVWRRLPPGMGAGFNCWDNEIIMPAVNTMELSEDEARKLNAFCYHERLHHFLTDDDMMLLAMVLDNPKLAKEIEEYHKKLKAYKKTNRKGHKPNGPKKMKRGMHCTLTNYIEDCRIELNEHCRFPGDLEDLLFYRKGEAADDFEAMFTLGLMMNPWGIIMQTLQYNLCEYRQFVIDPKQFPEQAKMYDIGWAILNDGRFEKSRHLQREGSATSLELAAEIIQAWKDATGRDIDKEAEKEEEGGKGKGKASGQGDPSDEEFDGPVEFEDPEEMEDGKNALFGEDEEDEGKAQPEEDGEEDAQSGPITDEDGERDIEAEFDRDQEKYEGRYNINPDDFNQKVADLARGDEEEEEACDDGTSGAGQPPDHEVTPDRKIGGGGNPYLMKCMKTPYIPYDVLDRMCYPKMFPENYSQVRQSIDTSIKRVTRELTRLLVSESQARTRKYLKKGKIDRRRLHAVVKGDDRVFKKTRKGQKNEVAVQLIIDLSGSMSGHKARLAVQVACLFAEVLNAMSMPFEVLGYNTSGLPWEHRKIAEKNGFDRWDIINHWVFKEFHENWSVVHARLGACCNGMRTVFGDAYIDTDSIPVGKKVVKDLDGCVGGANCDHETVLLGASRLYAQPQDRKLQIIIADGLPNGHYGDYGGQLQHMLVAVNNRIIASGIEQVAFGICCEGVKNFYSKAVVINNVDELGPQALNYLSASLRNYAMTTPDRWST